MSAEWIYACPRYLIVEQSDPARFRPTQAHYNRQQRNSQEGKHILNLPFSNHFVNVTPNQELELVDSLGDMSLTASLMAPKKKTVSNIHELDAQLASLDLASIDVVDSKSTEFKNVLQYSQDTYNGIGVSPAPSINLQTRANDIPSGALLRRMGKQTRTFTRCSGLSARANKSVGLAGVGIKLMKDSDCFCGTVLARPTLLVSSSKGYVSPLLKVPGLVYRGEDILTEYSAPATGYEFGKGVYLGDVRSIISMTISRS